MKGRVIVSVFFSVALLVLPVSGLSWVDPGTGQPSIQMIDLFLPTPLGPLALSRSYRLSTTEGILGTGWALDIVSRLRQPSKRDLLINQAGQASLLSRQKDDVPLKGAGGVRAYRNGEQWVVKSPSTPAMTAFGPKSGSLNVDCRLFARTALKGSKTGLVMKWVGSWDGRFSMGAQRLMPMTRKTVSQDRQLSGVIISS
ncbi:MAG: DUF6531 domain-containing protein [Methanosarcinaceae archaeon]|nr:DUF6531 domain-containing protein [Methanosarcinaceae archaeon]